MDASYWHERWGDNRIAFHEEQANALLVEYFSRLELDAGAAMHGIRFHPVGRRLYALVHDGSILVWDTHKGCRPRTRCGTVVCFFRFR